MSSPTNIRYFKKKAILFGMESVYGADPALVGTDWFEARNVTLTPFEAESAERGIVQPWMGNGGKLIVSTRQKLAFDVALAGSGVAGVAPKIGKLLRTVGFAETLNALHGGTATAGGASSITLAAGASAVDSTYNGMSIVIPAGTGSGQSRTVSAYVGATKVATVSVAWATAPDATSVYSIRDKVEYTLISEAFESGAFYVNIDGVLHKGMGVRGTASFKLDAKSIPLLHVELTALYTAPVDAAPPVVDRSGWPIERPVNSKNTLVCKVNSVDSFYSKFDFNLANQVTHEDFPGGYEVIKVGDRQPTASIVMLAELLAAIDPFTLANNSTSVAVQVVHGTTIGSKVQVDLKTKIVGVNNEDINGSVGYNLGLSPEPVSGNDEIKLTFL